MASAELLYWLPWAAMQLAYPIVLSIAARRNRAQRPVAARWTMFVAGLQVVSLGLNATLNAVPEPPTLNLAGPVAVQLNNPGVWAMLMRFWVQGLLPAAGLMILAYVILEQPDRPRAPRPEPAS